MLGDVDLGAAHLAADGSGGWRVWAWRQQLEEEFPWTWRRASTSALRGEPGSVTVGRLAATEGS